MAWPTEAGTLNVITAPPREHRNPRRSQSRMVSERHRYVPVVLPPPVISHRSIVIRSDRWKRRRIRKRGVVGIGSGRGQTNVNVRTYYATVDEYYYIFNAAEYRFYASTSGPPEEGDTPIATNATLPFSPTDAFTDGVICLSMSYFNGVLDSGFLPIGPNGETYLRLDLSSGNVLTAPPQVPTNVRLMLKPGGVVRVTALYVEIGPFRATDWIITYDTGGSPSNVGVPVYGNNLSVLERDLGPFADGTTVNVKVRMDNGRLGDNSPTLTVVADDDPPDLVESSGIWLGATPQDV